MNLCANCFTIFMSVTISTSIFVGHQIGKKNISEAKRYSKIGIGLAILMAIGITSYFSLFKKRIIS